MNKMVDLLTIESLLEMKKQLEESGDLETIAGKDLDRAIYQFLKQTYPEDWWHGEINDDTITGD